MNIDECFRVLELPDSASEAEVRQGYKLLVNVWHPDRFVGNEALRAEAERKLKTINVAFSLLEAAGFPRPREVVDVFELLSETPMPREPPPASLRWSVYFTILFTSFGGLALIGWRAFEADSLFQRLFKAGFTAALLAAFISQIISTVAKSVGARPRTWVIGIGAVLALAFWVIDTDPSLGPVLFVSLFLGGFLLVFVLMYLQSRRA